jgi:hypothetical protein
MGPYIVILRNSLSKAPFIRVLLRYKHFKLGQYLRIYAHNFRIV